MQVHYELGEIVMCIFKCAFNPNIMFYIDLTNLCTFNHIIYDSTKCLLLYKCNYLTKYSKPYIQHVHKYYT